MAWSYFTSNLSPGDVITRDQRNELLDAIEERVISAGNSGDGFHADMAAVRSDEIQTHLVKYTWIGSLYTESIPSAIQRICLRYAVSDSGTDLYLATTLRSAVAAALSVTSTHLQNAWDSTISSALGWNGMRQAVQLLAYPRLTRTGVAVLRRVADPTFPFIDTTWADAKNRFAAASESGDGISDPTLAGSKSFGLYNVSYYRKEATFSIPAIAPFSTGYDAWCFVQQGSSPGGGFYYVPSLATVQFDAAAEVQYTPPSTLTKLALASGQTVTGSRVVKYGFVGGTDDSELDLLDPTANADTTSHNYTSTLGIGNTVYLFIAPTFTHP